MEFFYQRDAKLQNHLYHEGTLYDSYNFLGAHQLKVDDRSATAFTVYAPHAKAVFLMGDFNNYDHHNLEMKRMEESGFFNIVVFDVKEEDTYKYRIITQDDQERIKADPYASYAEVRPNSASKVFDLNGYTWKDQAWQKKLLTYNTYTSPMSIYEVNLTSWMYDKNNELLTYRELANKLVAYVKKMNFTHVELMPIMEHPFDGSWGYQLTGFFAPTSRFGNPHDFMYLIDTFHQNNIGVILDFVPVHFCKDDHGLARFDGSALFEHEDVKRANNEGWGTLHFDYSKKFVHSFLISNALYWLDKFHIDGLRIDAVANMLYLDFAGNDVKNEYGGNENLDAIQFIKSLNKVVKERYPKALMIAEDSTSWNDVTTDVDHSLGFTYKWNMGYMHDTLKYMELDPLFRKGNHHHLTFGIMYAFNEHFILPFSHDEVVHGKKSLLDKMPGDYVQKFASLRLLLSYMYMYPGKKLLFMGSEFGQFIEWDEFDQLDWFLLEYPSHLKMQNFVKELNKLYQSEPSLYENDHTYEGFDWIQHTNHDESIISFKRISKDEEIIAIFNFTPVDRLQYPIGLDDAGSYQTLLHSDHQRYGGSVARVKTYKTMPKEYEEKPNRLEVDLPGLSAVILKKRSE